MSTDYAKLIRNHIKIKASGLGLEKQAKTIENIIKWNLTHNPKVIEAFNNNIQRELCKMVVTILKGDFKDEANCESEELKKNEREN